MPARRALTFLPLLLAASKPAASLVGPLLLDPNDPRTLYAGSQGRGFYKIRVP